MELREESLTEKWRVCLRGEYILGPRTRHHAEDQDNWRICSPENDDIKICFANFIIRLRNLVLMTLNASQIKIKSKFALSAIVLRIYSSIV